MEKDDNQIDRRAEARIEEMKRNNDRVKADVVAIHELIDEMENMIIKKPPV